MRESLSRLNFSMRLRLGLLVAALLCLLITVLVRLAGPLLFALPGPGAAAPAGGTLSAVEHGLVLGLIWLVAVAAVVLAIGHWVGAPLHELLDSVRKRQTAADQGLDLGAGAEEPDPVEALAQWIQRASEAFARRDMQLRIFERDVDRMVQERTAEMQANVSEALQAAARAEGLVRAKSEFLARMSHEIRTPMNGVLGMAELLSSSPTLDDRQRRYVMTIHQSGKTLLDIINDILDFSKAEAGKIELHPVPGDLRDVVDDALDVLAERAYTKGIDLVCDIPESLGTRVIVDPLRLRQVIINLLSNAVKFTERGQVTVSVQRNGSEMLDAPFEFKVADTGIGIKPENCAAIFESFVQEDSSTTRQYGGTGLGLAICRQLVELMGGQIAVTSVPGHGSTFSFTLPLPADPDPLAIAMTSQRLPRIRVLLVDESPLSRNLLMRQLAAWGVAVVETGDAEEALRILADSLSTQFDAVIIDRRRQPQQEQDLVRRIRGRRSAAMLPVIVLTSVFARGAQPRTAEDPATRYLSKPVRRTELFRCLMALSAVQPDGSRGWAPMADEPQQTTAGSTSVLRRLPLQRLLLVEDNAVNQEVALAILEGLGINAVTAWNGEEALEKLKSDRFDVVLMDCQMPRLDGYATTQRFRLWEGGQGLPRTPIVALTANSLDGDAEKCLAAGMDHYLSKPFTSEQLCSVLEQCVAGKDWDVAAQASPVAVQALAASGSAAPARTPAGANEPVLDAATLDRISSLQRPGAGNVLARVAELYISTSPPLVEAAHRAARSGDLGALRQSAHALKSSSANLGAVGFARLCGELEAAARAGDIAAGRQLVERLQSEHPRVLEALRVRTSSAA